jgi:hypothetical protein
MTATITHARPDCVEGIGRINEGGHICEPENAAASGDWRAPCSGVGPDSEDKRGTEGFVVYLGDAMGNWESDYLYGVPLVAHFDDFMEAKEYVVENLQAVITSLENLVSDVQEAGSFETLNLCCCDLISKQGNGWRGERDSLQAA